MEDDKTKKTKIDEKEEKKKKDVKKSGEFVPYNPMDDFDRLLYEPEIKL